MKKVFISIFLFYFSLSFSFSQEALKSVEVEYYDFLALQGIVERPTLGYSTLSDSVWNISEESTHIWMNNNLGSKKILWESENQGTNWFTKGFFHGLSFKIYGPEWFNSYNTTVPYGQNDGALWQGRGYNTSLKGGLRIEGYGFEVTIKPQFNWMQNKDFNHLPGVFGNINSYFWGYGIDLVQRYGDSSFYNFDLDDTEIRWNLYNFTIGFGYQKPWLGPAQENPILGSNNAPSYPKFDFGLHKTEIIIPGLNWNIGNFEGRFWCGKLSESDYFDNNSLNNDNIIYCFNLSYMPSFISNFTIGATKVCLTKWTNRNWKYIYPLYHQNDLNGVGEDQKASVYFDYLIPSVGFEIYGEIGIDDYTSSIISNPFHTWIYTLGVKKAFTVSDKKNIFGKFYFEFNDFEMSQDFQLQWQYMGYYSHGQILQGYTNKGQIIGAGSGYFGNSQKIGFDIYFPKGKFGLFFHRNAPDLNYIYNFAIDSNANNSNKYYATYECYNQFGIYSDYFVKSNFLIYSELSYIYINYKNYIKNNDLHSGKFICGVKFNF